MHAWYEIALLLVLGVVLFGLCQYNQQTLAWIVLFFPLALYIVKTLFVFNSVSSILRHVPPDMPMGSMPLPQGGPTPPQNSNHATSVTSQTSRLAVLNFYRKISSKLNFKFVNGNVKSTYQAGISHFSGDSKSHPKVNKNKKRVETTLFLSFNNLLILNI